MQRANSSDSSVCKQPESRVCCLSTNSVALRHHVQPGTGGGESRIQCCWFNCGAHGRDENKDHRRTGMASHETSVVYSRSAASSDFTMRTGDKHQISGACHQSPFTRQCSYTTVGLRMWKNSQSGVHRRRILDLFRWNDI